MTERLTVLLNGGVLDSEFPVYGTQETHWNMSRYIKSLSREEVLKLQLVFIAKGVISPQTYSLFKSLFILWFCENSCFV